MESAAATQRNKAHWTQIDRLRHMYLPGQDDEISSDGSVQTADLDFDLLETADIDFIMDAMLNNHPVAQPSETPDLFPTNAMVVRGHSAGALDGPPATDGATGSTESAPLYFSKADARREQNRLKVRRHYHRKLVSTLRNSLCDHEGNRGSHSADLCCFVGTHEWLARRSDGIGSQTGDAENAHKRGSARVECIFDADDKPQSLARPLAANASST